MKLFGNPESGHAFKVKLFLEVFSIEHDYEHVDIFSDRADRQEEFIQHARYGEVPLLLHEDLALTQSNAILLHLATHFEKGTGNTARSRQQCVEWLMWEANKIGMCLPQLRSFCRFEMNDDQQAAKKWLLDRYEHDVGVIERTLSDTRLWIIDGQNPTIADFSLSAYLFFAEEAQLQVPPNTTAWLERITALPGYQHPYTLLRET